MISNRLENLIRVEAHAVHALSIYGIHSPWGVTLLVEHTSSLKGYKATIWTIHAQVIWYMEAGIYRRPVRTAGAGHCIEFSPPVYQQTMFQV